MENKEKPINPNNPILKNTENKLISFDALISMYLYFNISKGRLRWQKDKQIIKLNKFILKPGLKIKKIEILCQYTDGDITNEIVDIFDDALSHGKDTLYNNIEKGVSRQDVEDLLDEEDKYDGKINEGKNIIVDDETQSDDIVGEIVKNGNFYYLVAGYNEKTNKYNLVFVYNGDLDTFHVKTLNDVNAKLVNKDNISTEEFNKILSKSKNTIFGDVGVDGFKLFKQNSISNYDGIINKPEEKVEYVEQSDDTSVNDENAEQSKNKQEIFYESDNIYLNKNPKDYPNIYKIKNNSEILVYINNLNIVRQQNIDNDTLTFMFTSDKMTEDMISYKEAKKSKILVNNYELRPKSEIGFLRKILPNIKITVFLNK
jgi:hypothetical protein